MITITFPDGASREYAAGTTGAEIAASISKSLAKKTVAMKLDGTVADLSDKIERDATLHFITRADPEAVELIRHDAAHVMAEAVQSLYPGTQVTIGPVIKDGFFYDFYRDTPFTTDDLPKIEAKMRQIIQANAPFTKEVWSRDKARQTFADMGEDFKVELVDAIPEDQNLNIYRQGEWFDLCRGPHMASTGNVGDAFKLMKVAGAYWRGDSNRQMLTRIYGTAWPDKKGLDAYLHMLEEAEKRDHRRLGREMNLFHFQEEAPGAVFWHEKGWRVFQDLVNYVRRRNEAAGYHEVNTPELMDIALWEASGHAEKFGDHMYLSTTPDERTYAIKPMNCPGHVQVFKNGLRSYRELPHKVAEFGKVHRYEASGALHGLMRVRAFTQDDAHVFCTEEQIAAECLKMNDLILSIYEDFGFHDVIIKFSDRPPVRVGEDHVWDQAEKALVDVLNSTGRKWSTNVGEGAFYGPKLEYTLRDAIGREWQCGTIQVDLNMPGRLGAFYIGADGEKHTPVMLHRAMVGSLERFLGILIENFAGHMPLWLSPMPVAVCTIVSETDDYALEVVAALKKAGLVAEADLRNEKINYKVREHSAAKVPVILVVGAREAEEGTVNMRRLGSRDSKTIALDDVVKMLADEATPPDVRRERAETQRPGPAEQRIDVVEVFEGFVVNDGAEGLSSDVFETREEALETARRILVERGGGIAVVSTLAGETTRVDVAV
ncbi:threonine--tRNA ligase [Acuticoccus sp. MNP-M23]|uniref:threonine--tRNA ligase n=1 Tax=Acuticoccus sp. MNP-M23 TaxID=3072793 RepID=UPI0028150FBA|nr:threonine--tRNA ligase [Acuticoccus sp. MNP-M23]WMS42501.1 threonine--tRNA ligase [Acuticoccus sp. MNP-M23]